ncbi:MAG TPA: T9SS type A sorting domain-containing protein, partial [Bacteroidales bacterium]|nr:T9SS type A sorting domain-containing protein [Bacteroidales bacterium]
DYNPVVRDQQSPVCAYTLSAPVAISEPAVVEFASQEATNITCNGADDGTITVAATGGTGTYTYTMNPLSTTNPDGLFDALTPGNYTVDVSDENNCSATSAEISITEPKQLALTGTSAVDLNCFDAANGTITINASGGTVPYTFILSPGDLTSNTGEFTGLDAGTYQATITDANGCGPIVTGSIEVVQPDEILISRMSTQDVSVAGGNDGLISITATGGTGSLLFSINGNPSQTGSTFENLYPGDYTIAITDENGCGPVYSSVIPVNEPTEITPVAGSLKGMIYPNPAHPQFTLELEGVDAGNCAISLVNMQGQQVFTKTYPVAADSKLQEVIDPGTVPSGIYLIRVNNILLKEKLVIR